ncbi:unnamed protein product [Darwinula stevensoni]|uniref:Uncharacterized protein n=1 Tax=Darwinula stevensoni TaxID=69355 RepID=A0A7R8X5T6_9CRUS|nr:unnamed protein product [Darwinula stevensoni]CAG0885158.1 unnamed protein product [Darwinula stevensoni]
MSLTRRRIALKEVQEGYKNRASLRDAAVWFRASSEEDEVPLLLGLLVQLDGDGATRFVDVLPREERGRDGGVAPSEPACFSFSSTKSAGLTICRLADDYDPPRTADPDSKFFFRDVPPGYNLVPGTKSYLKMVWDTLGSVGAAAKCADDGGGLAVPSLEPVFNYINKSLMDNASKITYPFYVFRVDGKPLPTNGYVWLFRDGTNVTYTGRGQGHFHPIHPTGIGPCLGVAYNDIGAPPNTFGVWVDSPCTDGGVNVGGYFCEIRVPDVTPR